MDKSKMSANVQKRSGISPEFYTIKEAASLIGVHPMTFWRWLKKHNKNTPPSRRFGGAIRIPKQEFHQYMNGK